MTVTDTTVISRARTWVIKLDVRDAPLTHRQYSDHMIVPDRIEINYLQIGRDPVKLASARIMGVVHGDTTARRLEALYFTGDKNIPDWAQDLIKKYYPN